MTGILAAVCFLSAWAGHYAADEPKCRAKGWDYSYTEEREDERIVHCKKPKQAESSPIPKMDRGAIEPASWFVWTWRDREASLTAFHEIALDPEAFATSAGAQSLEELIHARDAKAGARSAGPDEPWRYVRDPASPGRVIDMRHFLSVGSRRFPEGAGLGIELIQWLWARNPMETAARRQIMGKTAFDPQDFYSNALGAEFFSKHYRLEAGPVGAQIARFLSKRGAAHAAP